MGCCSADKGKQNVPILLCFYELANDKQKNYCINLRYKWQYNKDVQFDIKSIPQVPFAIKLKIYDEIYEIQGVFDDCDDKLKSTLQQAYDLLNEKYR